jgi:dolichol-phosphate mannosyltransferase
MARRQDLIELAKFSVVGGSGFVINLAVYALAHSVLGVHYFAAATLAFAVANTSNYLMNRWWTFAAQGNARLAEYARFLTVGLAALTGNLLVLGFLVETLGVPEVPAQAVAVLIVMPTNFVGNKLWTFRRRA